MVDNTKDSLVWGLLRLAPTISKLLPKSEAKPKTQVITNTGVYCKSVLGYVDVLYPTEQAVRPISNKQVLLFSK